MAKLLYHNFLNDKKIYNLAVAYWQRYFDLLLGKNNYQAYLTTGFVNGQKFYDGNPMFTALLTNSDRAVRIVQEEAEADELEIGAWLDRVELPEKNVNELVIHLVLSKESLQIAREWIQKWLLDKINTAEMQKIIEASYQTI